MDQHQDQMRFSIVVPAFNEAAYLGTALTSLQQQDYQGHYEIVVVDNNSTDDTAAVADRHGVRVVREPEQGVCAARQRGAEVTSGEILISVDADSRYPSDWLRTIDERFSAEPQIVAVAGPCRYENPSWWSKRFPTLLFGMVAGVFAMTGFVFYVSATNIAMRRSAFPGYNTNLTQGGDELDLLRRLRHRGRVVWERRNIVSTSSRRMDRGLIYNIVISGFVYYFLGYVLNRLFAHRTIGMAPAFRQERKFRHRRPSPLPVTGTVDTPDIEAADGAVLARWRHRRIAVGVMVVVVGVTSLGLAKYAGPQAMASLIDYWNSP